MFNTAQHFEAVSYLNKVIEKLGAESSRLYRMPVTDFRELNKILTHRASLEQAVQALTELKILNPIKE